MRSQSGPMSSSGRRSRAMERPPSRAPGIAEREERLFGRDVGAIGEQSQRWRSALRLMDS